MWKCFSIIVIGNTEAINHPYPDRIVHNDQLHLLLSRSTLLRCHP